MVDLDRPASALLTDLYQLTMAAGYWRSGNAAKRSVFHLFFRKAPFGGAYAVCAGTESVARFLRDVHFSRADLDFLASLRGNDGGPLFPDGFIEFLAAAPPGLGLDVDAMREGTVVFPREPLLRVHGPLWAAQIVETALLTMMNFETLIATKASRVVRAAGGGQVLEFGLRRAQGVDGGLAATRAAWVGGAHATSNVLAGRLWQIPVRGTHAHAWVMSFPDEVSAFAAYADALPNNALFLVDTYDTLQGVRHAIAAGDALRARGQRMMGIRLDSGDLVALSREARRMLDEAGFTDAAIVASDDLDEHRIAELRAAGARIDVWGVGTRLVTGHDQPALGGVYKLGAIEQDGGWRFTIKRSENPLKVSDPGILGVRRYTRAGVATHDVLYATDTPPEGGEDLLAPLLRGGQLVDDVPDANAARAMAAASLASMPDDVRALKAATPYPVHVEPTLADRKARMLEALG